jgi:cell division protein FtsB
MRVMQRAGQTASWLLPFCLLVLAIVAVPLRILDEQGLPRYRALLHQRDEIRVENERLRREVRDLERDVHALRTRPETIERIARDELGMVREGEIVFQFDP